MTPNLGGQPEAKLFYCLENDLLIFYRIIYSKFCTSIVIRNKTNLAGRYAACRCVDI